MIGSLIIIVVFVPTAVIADYECLCNYDVEKAVLPSPNNKDTPIGYLYEFDCKATAPGIRSSSKYQAIAYEHTLAYVELVGKADVQICQGDVPTDDILTTTTTTAIPIPASHTKTALTHSTPPTTTGQSTTLPSTPTRQSTTQPTTTTTKYTTSRATTIQTTATSNTTSTQSTTSSTTTTTQSTTVPMTTSTESTTAAMTTSTQSTISSTTTTKQSTILPKTTSMKSTIMPTTTTHSTIMPTTTTHSTTIPTTTTHSTTIPTTTTHSTTIPTTTTHSTTIPTTTSLKSTISYNNVYITGSPLAYIGIGYDLLTGNPSGFDGSNGGGDPGLMVNRRIFQLTASNKGSDVKAREAEVTTLNRCNHSQTSALIFDGKSYMNELKSFVTLIESGDVQLNKKAFTLNPDFVKVRRQTESGARDVYQDVMSYCVLGTARYREELAHASGFSVSSAFARDVCQLPYTYDSSLYRRFIDKWGTSIVMSVKTGTLSVKRYKNTALQIMSDLSHIAGQKVSMYHPSGQFGGYPTSVTINFTSLPGTSIRPSGALITTHQIGTNAMPVPVSMSLVPITDALDIQYWTQALSHGHLSDSCHGFDGAALANVKSDLQTAIQDYTVYKTAGQKPLKDLPLTVPMTWPDGTYGLMEAANGCPGSHVTWETGWRKYDTEDTDSHNYFSTNINNYIGGVFQADDIVTKFCMKTQASTDATYSHAWPVGNYCILKRGNCPSGLVPGKIHWDDDDFFNINEAGGTLPDGAYNSNTDIYYCCRVDGSPDTPVLLPRDKNFILLRHGSRCQAVYDMTVHEVFVRWDDEDVLNKDSASGTHPFDDGGSKDHILHFCYYSPIHHTFQPGLVG